MLGDRFGETVLAAKGGDSVAFGALWEATHPMLVRYLRVRAGDHAEDVASQTWVHVIEGLGRFEGDEPGFRRWVVTIARNTHVDLVRRHARRPEIAVDEPAELTRQPLVDDVADLVGERDATRSAIGLLKTLPDEQAEMVALRVVVGLDVAEVAALTGRTPGSVRVSVHRALRRLRDTVEAGAPAGVTGATSGDVMGTT